MRIECARAAVRKSRSLPWLVVAAKRHKPIILSLPVETACSGT
jgi:hypothetical protein